MSPRVIKTDGPDPDFRKGWKIDLVLSRTYMQVANFLVDLSAREVQVIVSN